MSNSDFKKDRVISFCNTLSNSLQFECNKNILKNIVYVTGRLLPGSNAMDFQLFSSDNTPVSLSSYKGKYVYLAFVRNKCTHCEEEIKLMPAIKKKYGHFAEFVYINIDHDKKEFEIFRKNYEKPGFPVLHFNNDYQLTEFYNAVSVPCYLLINEFGNIVLSNAPAPGIDLEKLLNDLSKKKK